MNNDSFLLFIVTLSKSMFPYEGSCYQNAVKLQYTQKHNAQHSTDPHCSPLLKTTTYSLIEHSVNLHVRRTNCQLMHKTIDQLAIAHLHITGTLKKSFTENNEQDMVNAFCKTYIVHDITALQMFLLNY